MVIKTVTVRFGKCTTLLVPKSWPMKAWLQDGDQWKAENLAGSCNWPITRRFIQNDRARLIIDHSTNFALSGNIDGPCTLLNCASRKSFLLCWVYDFLELLVGVFDLVVIIPSRYWCMKLCDGVDVDEWNCVMVFLKGAALAPTEISLVGNPSQPSPCLSIYSIQKEIISRID